MTALAASNQRVRRLRRLSGRRSARADEGAFLLEGPVLVAEALAADVSLEGVYLDDDHQLDTQVIDLIRAAERRAVPVHRVAPGVLVGITDSVTPRPVLAVAPIPVHDVAGLVTRAAERRRHLVVLVDVRDPGNLGTIIRAADASGAVGVLCTTGTVDPWSPKVVRSSAGAVLHVPVATGLNIDGVFEMCEGHGLPTVATVVDGGTPYDQLALAGPVALVLGNEAAGLSSDLVARLDLAATIPMDGRAESLNVAMAASVLCFEALRQRRSMVSTQDSDWTQADTDDKVITP